jgi:hypothetical protein
MRRASSDGSSRDALLGEATVKCSSRRGCCEMLFWERLLERKLGALQFLDRPVREMVRQPTCWGRQFTNQPGRWFVNRLTREKGQTAFLVIREPKVVFFKEKLSLDKFDREK